MDRAGRGEPDPGVCWRRQQQRHASTISAENPSISARLDILSLPDFSTALTVACAAPEVSIIRLAMAADFMAGEARLRLWRCQAGPT